MKVLVDAVQLTGLVTGTDRLAYNVLRELSLRQNDMSYDVLVNAQHDYVWGALGSTMRPRPVPGRMRLRWYAQALRQHAREVDADVILSFFNCVGPLWGGPPSVVSVLDLVPFHFDAGYFPNTRTRIVLRGAARQAARHAARLVAISEHGRNDAVTTLGVDPAHVSVATLQADPRFTTPDPDARRVARRALALPDNYVLAAGANEPRKNVARLLQAHRRLPIALRAQFPLVVMGPTWGDAADHDDDPYLMQVGYVPEQHLPSVYAEATVFAFLSLYEGFGLPPLEAMACGAAVLLSNVSSMPEVGGDAAAYADPASTESITSALVALLSNAGERDRLRALGRQQVRQFSWARTAEVYARAVAEAAKRL